MDLAYAAGGKGLSHVSLPTDYQFCANGGISVVFYVINMGFDAPPCHSFATRPKEDQVVKSV